MPPLIAICDQCSRPFPSGIMAENVRSLTIQNVGGDPCPYCGQNGRVPDGIYDVVDETIKVLLTSSDSSRAFERLSQVLSDLKNSGERNTDKLAEKIEQDAPEFSSVAKLIKRVKNLTAYEWLSLLLAIIPNVLYVQDYAATVRTEDQVNQIYTRVVEQAKPKNSFNTQEIGSPGDKFKHVDRNKRCPCGPGLKYKKCHGR